MSRTDLTTLQAVVAALAERAGRERAADGWLIWSTPTMSHRWLIPSWKRLATTDSAEGVGFFGELRAGGSDDFPPDLEPRVADRAAGQGWLLAYLNVRFIAKSSCGAPRYANLVVMSDRAAAQSLANDATHAEAVTRAASAYHSIRIHRLAVTGPLIARPQIRITETLSIDYASTPPTRAVTSDLKGF
jgi:hypothetical protein